MACSRSPRGRSGARTKVYYFPGRTTPVIAKSAAEARRKKTRPKSDRIVSWRYPKPGEGAGSGPKSKRWSRLRPDGKSPGTSRYTRRGLGPKPKRKK